MKHWIVTPAFAAAAILASPAAAADVEDPIGVVELFTSQGCNSCPPADAVFSDLAKGGDVVALAYHIDYWDYLGWADTMASAENTARQYEYGKAFGDGSVYTPQAVINGRLHVNGSSRSKVERALERMADTADGMTVDVSIKPVGDAIIIDTGAGRGNAPEAHVVLVYFQPARPVEIQRGENRGKTIVYWNAVSAVQTAGMWHGEAKRFEIPASEIARKGKGGCAVLVQSVRENGVPGPILGAALMAAPEM